MKRKLLVANGMASAIEQMQIALQTYATKLNVAPEQSVISILAEIPPQGGGLTKWTIRLQLSVNGRKLSTELHVGVDLDLSLQNAIDEMDKWISEQP